MISRLKSSSPALATGATGRHGATGPRIARLLLEQGLAVRAMVHRPDEHSSNLVGLGVEVVIARERRGRSKLGPLIWKGEGPTAMVRLSPGLPNTSGNTARLAKTSRHGSTPLNSMTTPALEGKRKSPCPRKQREQKTKKRNKTHEQ